MKKIYVRPTAESVNVKLSGSVLDIETPVGGYSLVGKPEDSFGKQNDFWEEDDFNGDIWGTGDAGDSGNAYDIWGE